MSDAPNALVAEELTTHLVWEGLFSGGKTGLIASTLYAAIGMIIAEFLGQGMDLSWLPSQAENWGQFVLMMVTIVTMILFVAIIPATIIGALTGLYIGQLTKLFGEIIPRHLFLALCVSFCLVVVISFHTLLRIPVTLSFQSSDSALDIGVYGTYPFSIGIPSVIYVLLGIWVGWTFHSKVGIQSTDQA
jgi:hypothetical protein